MKKYRLTKRIVDFGGNVFEPQDMQAEDLGGGLGIVYSVKAEGVDDVEIGINVDELLELEVDYIEEVIPKRWRASKWGNYFSILDNGEVYMLMEAYLSSDEDKYRLGNYFQTKEQAQAVAKKIKTLLQEEQDKLSKEDK